MYDDGDHSDDDDSDNMIGLPNIGDVKFHVDVAYFSMSALDFGS